MECIFQYQEGAIRHDLDNNNSKESENSKHRFYSVILMKHELQSAKEHIAKLVQELQQSQISNVKLSEELEECRVTNTHLVQQLRKRSFPEVENELRALQVAHSELQKKWQSLELAYLGLREQLYYATRSKNSCLDTPRSRKQPLQKRAQSLLCNSALLSKHSYPWPIQDQVFLGGKSNGERAATVNMKNKNSGGVKYQNLDSRAVPSTATDRFTVPRSRTPAHDFNNVSGGMIITGTNKDINARQNFILPEIYIEDWSEPVISMDEGDQL